MMARLRLDRSAILAAMTFIGALALAPAHAGAALSCSLSATSLAFNNYLPASTTPDDINATITVNCTATGAAATLSGAISLTSSSTSHGRQLTSGTYILPYQTYLDAGRTQFWGNGTGRGLTVPVSGSVSPGTPFQQAFTVYGRILARQSSVHVGNYTDVVTVTLNY
jgi:spore coat protein U-like protein